jgi:hypothetical protein
MTISFDLDDTLIPGTNRFPLERAGIWHRLFSRERLREGTVYLFRELKERGCTIYIYTTSYRSPGSIRRLFMSYGIYPDRIINKTLHDNYSGKRGRILSKYPPAFGIDWHVDDSEGVKIEGERWGFRVMVVDENDEDWVSKVLRLPDV